ncbi:MAG: hypothetical protein Q8M99_11005 [Methylotenera sp.]|nr:hypothetical protein [Methylotenera sp.]
MTDKDVQLTNSLSLQLTFDTFSKKIFKKNALIPLNTKNLAKIHTNFLMNEFLNILREIVIFSIEFCIDIYIEANSVPD